MLSSDAALIFLTERQRAEGLSANAMARKLGIDLGTWWQIRRGRRQMTQAQIVSACLRYPELRDQLFAEALAS